MNDNYELDHSPHRIKFTFPLISRADLSLMPWKMSQSDAELLREMMKPDATVGRPTLKTGMALTTTTRPVGP